jgi:hypothetical protein
MMVVVAVMMMTVPAMMAMPPTHFGYHRLGVLLHGRGRGGIAERQRVGALARRGDHEQCANGGKAQNFYHLHGYLLGFLISRP